MERVDVPLLKAYLFNEPAKHSQLLTIILAVCYL